jgi:hypothetical protein
MKPMTRTALAVLFLTPVALATPSASFDGQPSAFKPGSANMVAVWQDEAGLHLRFTTDETAQRYTGKVCGKDKVEHLRPFALEKQDKVWIGPEGKCVWFKLWTQGFSDGFDVQALGAIVFFDLRRDNATIPPENVWLGKNNVHPEHSPFVLERD